MGFEGIAILGFYIRRDGVTPLQVLLLHACTPEQNSSSTNMHDTHIATLPLGLVWSQQSASTMLATAGRQHHQIGPDPALLRHARTAARGERGAGLGQVEASMGRGRQMCAAFVGVGAVPFGVM